MLQLNYIRENRDTVIERLAVKHFKEIGLVDEIISLDEERRKIQSESDTLSAEANAAAKQIGDLMRQGKKEEAETVKSKSSGYKEQVKQLLDQLGTIEAQLNEKIVQLPNLPHQSVPAGVSAEDNEVVLSHGEIPALSEEALPHWELLNKYCLLYTSPSARD